MKPPNLRQAPICLTCRHYEHAEVYGRQVGWACHLYHYYHVNDTSVCDSHPSLAKPKCATCGGSKRIPLTDEDRRAYLVNGWRTPRDQPCPDCGGKP